VFWFHPAIWWVLGEVQLAREQAVDRRVVELTAAREPYVDALLAMAGARPQLDLAPAPLFLRKRHLKHRVVEILKEANVSKKRLISALAAAVAIMAAVSWFVTGAIPLAASPQVVADAPGVAVNLNGARLMHRSAVAYPPEAAAKGTQGTVTVQVKLNGNGEVIDAVVLSGPEELRKPVLQSVLAWHFMKEIGGTTQTVSVEFSAPQQQAVPRAADLDPSRAIPRKAAGGSATHLITGIDVTGLSDQARGELLAQLPVHAGDTIGPEQMAAVMRAVHNYDPHLAAGLTGSPTEARLRITAPGAGVAGGVVGGIAGGVGGGVPGGIMASGPGGATAQPASVPGRIFVAGETEATKLVSQTPPEYPALAKQARISGRVELSAVIGKDGHVINLSVVMGHPLLVQAALDAVRNWVYEPTLLNGEPVEVATNITVNFTLAQ
jgi:TonB family protein